MQCNYFGDDKQADKKDCFSRIGLYGKHKITEKEYTEILVQKYTTSIKKQLKNMLVQVNILQNQENPNQNKKQILSLLRKINNKTEKLTQLKDPKIQKKLYEQRQVKMQQVPETKTPKIPVPESKVPETKVPEAKKPKIPQTPVPESKAPKTLFLYEDIIRSTYGNKLDMDQVHQVFQTHKLPILSKLKSEDKYASQRKQLSEYQEKIVESIESIKNQSDVKLINLFLAIYITKVHQILHDQDNQRMQHNYLSNQQVFYNNTNDQVMIRT